MKQLNLLLWLFSLLLGLSSQTMAQNKVANKQTPATAIAKGIAQTTATPAKQSGVASPNDKGLQARKHARRLMAGQKPTFTMLNATANSSPAKAVTTPAVAAKVTEREVNAVDEAKKSLLTQRINEAIRNAPKPRIVSSEEQQILDTISKLSLQFEMGVIQKGTAAAQVLEDQLNLYAQQLQLIHQNLNK